MPPSLTHLITQLDTLARYDGPWRALQSAGPLLRNRVEELRERAEHLDDVLIIALVGGSGVGKSTFLNALAGDELAKTSPYRPCTAFPTVYAPPGVLLPFDDWHHVTGSALENLVIIDTPDSDTIVHEHRERTLEVLRYADLILLCASAEKYLDEATWSLLRPLRGERTFVCVQTKAAGADGIREHWLQRLDEEGFKAERYFRVNALRTFDRKAEGGAPDEAELDFPALERFLQDELSTDRIERIKRSNVSGLLRKTMTRLEDLAQDAREPAANLEKQLAQSEKELAQSALGVIEQRLFRENHLWTFALGREVSLRAKGIVGTAGRAVEALRSLPARVGSWVPGLRAPSTGKRAADMLASEPLFTEDLEVASDEIASYYASYQRNAALALAKSGLADRAGARDGSAFADTLNERVSRILRGAGRDAVGARARMLTSWPVALLADAPLVALVAFSGYRLFDAYFSDGTLPNEFVSLSVAVAAIVLVAELFVLGAVTRFFAWTSRTQALLAMRAAFLKPGLAFQEERAIIEDIREQIERIDDIARSVR